MASDQIMIYDQIKLKIFESGILLGIMENAKITGLESLEEKDIYTNNNCKQVLQANFRFFPFARNLWLIQPFLFKIWVLCPLVQMEYNENISFYDFLPSSG